jgi:hypothetical protein
MYEKRKLVLPLKKYKYFGTQRVKEFRIVTNSETEKGIWKSTTLSIVSDFRIPFSVSEFVTIRNSLRVSEMLGNLFSS